MAVLATISTRADLKDLTCVTEMILLVSYDNVQVLEMKSKIIALGSAFGFFSCHVTGSRLFSQFYKHVYLLSHRKARAPGLLVHIQVIIPQFIRSSLKLFFSTDKLHCNHLHILNNHSTTLASSAAP